MSRRILTITKLLPFVFTNMHFSDPSTGNFNAAYNNPGRIRINALFAISTIQSSSIASECRGEHSRGHALHPDPRSQHASIRHPEYVRHVLSCWVIPYRYQAESWSASRYRSNGIPRMGSNVFGYRLGNELQTTAWVQRRLVEVSMHRQPRLDGHLVGNIARADGQLDPTFSPANLPSPRVTSKSTCSSGGTFFWPDGRIPGQRLSFEAGLPISPVARRATGWTELDRQRRLEHGLLSDERPDKAVSVSDSNGPCRTLDRFRKGPIPNSGPPHPRPPLPQGGEGRCIDLRLSSRKRGTRPPAPTLHGSADGRHFCTDCAARVAVRLGIANAFL